MKKIFKHKYNLLLICILALGALLRFYGINWDQDLHMHPDERFLTMVGNAMKLPDNFQSYLDPRTSSFNPQNIGFQFFVYGIFPLTLNKLLTIFLNTDTYNGFTIYGRFLSALCDLLIIFLVYKTVKLLEYKYSLSSQIKYWAAFFYAVSVLPIQLSHFFATDTFLNFFMFASFYFALRFSVSKKMINIMLSAIFLGFAISSKVNALSILPLNIFLISEFLFTQQKNVLEHIVSLKKTIRKKKTFRHIYKLFFILFIYFLFMYICVRLTDPYLFENMNFFNFSLSSSFIQNLKTLQEQQNSSWFPPAVQWVNKPILIFSLVNLAFFGLGIPYFILAMAGGIYMLKSKKMYLIIICIWLFSYFLYQSVQVVKIMRYFIMLYPFFAILAGIGIIIITNIFPKYRHILKFLILMLVLIWPLSFMYIYSKPHVRVEASYWIINNIPKYTTLAQEHWDDSLPLWVEGYSSSDYNIIQLPVFDPDKPEKMQNIKNLLKNSDYIIFTSNRGYGSIMTVPNIYPFMYRFYDDLFKEKLEFNKVKEFTRYPTLSLFGINISFPDQWSDEAFTVYDHPKVTIYQKKQIKKNNYE